MQKRLLCLAFLLTLAHCRCAPLYADAVRLNIEGRGTDAVEGWTAWRIGAGVSWSDRGPFSFHVDRATFDPDGFTVVLGPAGGIGLRPAPHCPGALGAVIEDVPFCRTAKPFQIRLQGLRAGTYRIVTWHNDARGYKAKPFDIFVTDARRTDKAAVEGLQPTGVRNAADAAQAALVVEANGADDIVIRFRIRGAERDHLPLNAIEIIAGQDAYRASLPHPGPGATNVPRATTLRWRAGAGATRHEVHLGTSAAALALAGTVDGAAQFEVRNLRLGQTYHWRVDEIGPAGTHRGPVWTFATVRGNACSPLPINDADEVSMRTALRWQPGLPDARHTIYLGADPGALECIAGEQTKPAFAPRDLRLGHTYYWRVNEHYGDQAVPGDLWRFTTESGAAKAPRPADREGYVDANAALRWTRADTAERHDIYLGASPDQLILAGRGVTGTEYVPEGLEVGRTYYWRVDAVHGDNTVAGPVWSFTVGDWRVGDGLPRSKTASIVGIRGAWTGGYEKTAAAGKATDLRTDVCVVGGGSGGIGAAVAAARAGASVILVERQARLGGTSTQAYVNSWEPGPGCSIAREIHDRLAKIPNALKCADYDRTLSYTVRRGVQFEVEPFHRVVNAMLAETGRCRVLLNTSFIAAETHIDGGRVWSIRAVSKAGTTYRIRAAVFIDCTGGAYLCQAAGCEMMLGEDAKSRFGEPSAPEKPRKMLNAIILGYRIRRSANPKAQPPVPGLTCKGGYAFSTPNGDKIVNPCGGMMKGWDLIARGYPGAMAECERRVRAHWHWMQKTHYPGWELVSIAPMLGIRESYRVVGEYVLREQDVVGGLGRQSHPDIIAVADHAIDTHGCGAPLRSVRSPYGIPYRCLVPKDGWANLLVACRGASFSHIAASSCRLSRTMMQLGHAAGLAAAQAVHTGRGVGKVDITAIQQQLGMPPDRPPEGRQLEK